MKAKELIEQLERLSPYGDLDVEVYTYHRYSDNKQDCEIIEVFDDSGVIGLMLDN